MKRKYLFGLLSFVCCFVFALSAYARCYYGENYSFDYGENGGVQVKNQDGEVVATYASMDALLLDRFGFVPEVNIDMNKFTAAGHNSSNSSAKTRGRLIYSVQEANEVAKDGSVNKVRLRYK